jgi:hypothetical protein
MPDELFPPSSVESLSPRLQWLKRNDLVTKQQGYAHTVHPLSWCCSNRATTMCGWGETELDATIDYCNRYKIKHWSLEP